MWPFKKKKNMRYPFHSEDRFIVSFPKSGSTWLRFIIGSYITDEEFDFHKGRVLITDIHADKELALAQEPPRLLKSHDPYNPNYQKVLHIVRDVRSVVISYYYHQLKFKLIDQNTTIEQFVEDYLDDKYLDWGEHTMSWYTHSMGLKKYLSVKYEDLKVGDNVALIGTILKFLEIDDNPDALRIGRALSNSSIDKMRKKELSQRDSIPTHKNSRTDINFIRKGSVNEFESLLSDAQLEQLIEKFSEPLKQFGYLDDLPN